MFIGAYWDARQETLEQSAGRVASALKSLAAVDGRLSQWFLKGRTRKSSNNHAVKIDAGEVASVLKTNNRDKDKSAITELGFNVGLWNGSDSFPCSFNATCGGFSNFVKNSVVVQLPGHGNSLSALSEKALHDMVVGVVKAFDPAVAVLTSNEFIDQHGGGAPWDAGGWIVYRRDAGIDNMETKGCHEQ